MPEGKLLPLEALAAYDAAVAEQHGALGEYSKLAYHNWRVRVATEQLVGTVFQEGLGFVNVYTDPEALPRLREALATPEGAPDA